MLESEWRQQYPVPHGEGQPQLFFCGAEGQCQRSLWTVCMCYLLASEKFGLVSWLVAGLGLAPAPDPGSLTGEAKGADTQWPVVLLGVRGGVGLPGTWGIQSSSL